jgi:Glycine zipper 2TM domain
MRHPFRGPTRAMVLAVAVLAVTACTERRTAERADSDLSHDLALANQISAQPALKDTAIAPAPAAQPQQPPATPPRAARTRPVEKPVPQPVLAAPAPAAASTAAVTASAPDSSALAAIAPAPAPMVVDAGTGLTLSSGMRVCTNSNKIGDKLVATVTNPVTGSGGAMIPSGSRVVLEVSQVAPDDTMITFQPTALYVGGSTYQVLGTVRSTTPMQRAEVPSTGPSNKEKIVGGAVAGAILGQLFGHNTKSTVIGAAAGAATGAAVAHATTQYQVCLPEGATLVLTLSSPLTMH